jgi:hypothetical protein
MYGRCKFPLLKNKCLLSDYFHSFNQLWKEPRPLWNMCGDEPRENTPCQ